MKKSSDFPLEAPCRHNWACDLIAIAPPAEYVGGHLSGFRAMSRSRPGRSHQPPEHRGRSYQAAAFEKRPGHVEAHLLEGPAALFSVYAEFFITFMFFYFDFLIKLYFFLFF